MNFEKVGGRKFLIALLSLAAGIAIEVLKPQGLSMEMTGFLLGLVAAFSVGNVVSKKVGPGRPDQLTVHGVSDSNELSLGDIADSGLEHRVSLAEVQLSELEGRLASIEAAGEQVVKSQQQLSQTLQQLVAKGIFNRQ